MSNEVKKIAREAYNAVIENTPSFLVTKEIYEQKFAELFLEDIIKVMTKLDYHGEWLGSELKKHYGFEDV